MRSIQYFFFRFSHQSEQDSVSSLPSEYGAKERKEEEKKKQKKKRFSVSPTKVNKIRIFTIGIWSQRKKREKKKKKRIFFWYEEKRKRNVFPFLSRRSEQDSVSLVLPSEHGPKERKEEEEKEKEKEKTCGPFFVDSEHVEHVLDRKDEHYMLHQVFENIVYRRTLFFFQKCSSRLLLYLQREVVSSIVALF